MRKIKFRGKRIDSGKWIFGGLLYSGNDTFIVERIMYRDNHCNVAGSFRVDPKTVGQFTERKDKNGKEVYEGDIVKNHHNIPRKIIFEDGCFVMQDIQKREDGKQYTDFMALYKFIWNDGYEIIGNIFDNPELKGGK